MIGPESEHSMGEVDRPTSTLEEALKNCIIATENAGLDDGVAALEYIGGRIKLMADRGEIVTLPSSDPDNPNRELIEQRFVLENDITPQEWQIFKLMSSGKKNRQIATELEISTSTVKTHRLSIFKRLGVHNAAEAVTKFAEYK